MDTKLHKFLPFVWFFCLRDSLGNHCTVENINLCWAPVDSYLESQGHDPDHSEFAYFDLSEAELRGYCSIYHGHTSPCLADIVRHCTYETKKEFEGLEESEDFFCNEGLEVYIKHKDCIGSNRVQAQFERCTDELNQDLDYISSLFLTSSEADERACKAVYDYLACDKDAAAKSCGAEAADWVETYETKLYSPLLEHYGCYLDRHAGNDNSDSSNSDNNDGWNNIGNNNDGNNNYGRSNRNRFNDNGSRDTTSIIKIVSGSFGGVVFVVVLIGCCIAMKRRSPSSGTRPGQPSVAVAYVHQPGTNNVQIQGATAPPTVYPDKIDEPPAYYEKVVPPRS